MDRKTQRVEHSRTVPGEPDQRPLIPEYIVDPASQRIFAVLIFAAIQCWKIYDILLVKADAFALSSSTITSGGTSTALAVPLTSLNNFTFVVKYALVDGIFLWILPVFNIPLLSFLPLMTLLLTVAINLANFVLTSTSALPLLLSTFVPLWNMFHRHKELTILGDSVAPKLSIDTNAHFRGRYTIQYLPELSVTLNPFGFNHMCLESPDLDSLTFPSTIDLPIEFNTTSDVGFMLLQRLTPENTVEFVNFTRSEIKKMARKTDKSKYASLPGFVRNDERVFYLAAEISKPGKYKVHQVLDIDGMTIRSYRSEFAIGYCPFSKFVYPGAAETYSGYKCFSKDVSELSWTVPMVSAFGMLPLTVQLATYQNGKKINTFEKTIDGPEQDVKVGSSWLKSHKITRNSLEQELLRAPQSFVNVGLGKLEFQLLSISDSHGNKRLYNDQSKDSDVNFGVELKKAPSFTLRDKHPSRKLVMKSSKTLHIESSEPVVFPIKVNIVHEKEDSAASPETLEFVFHNRDELARGLKISDPGTYRLVSGADKYCPCEAETSPLEIVRPPLPSVKITEVPILDKCVGTIGYEFVASFSGSPPFELLYEVYKNVLGIIKPVLSDVGAKTYSQKSLKNELKFDFKPKREGNYILAFKNVKDLYYNHAGAEIPLAENTFTTQIKKRSLFVFFRDAHLKVHTINLCKGQLSQVPVYFDGHFPFSFTSEIVDLLNGNVLHRQTHENKYEDVVTLQIPTFAQGGEYAVRLKDVTDSLGCPAELTYDQQVRIKARKDTPQVWISESSVTQVVEGDSVSIPLSVDSSSGLSSSDSIIYVWTSLYDGTDLKNFTLHGKSGLVVRDEGIYKLLSFTNSGCVGGVKNSDTTFTLRHHAKPNVTVVPDTSQILNSDGLGEFSLKPLCQDDVQKVKVELEGHKPFLLNYEITFPSGKLKAALIEIDNTELMLPLQTLREGRYKISFTHVYDSLYTKEKMLRLLYKQVPQVISYEVKLHPKLQVKEGFIQLCESKVKEDFDLHIPVALEGTAPFHVEGLITTGEDSKSRPFVIEDLRGSVISLKHLNIHGSYIDVFTVGEHVIRFDSISDASQCKSRQLVEDNSVLVSITQIPTITKRNLKEFYCVGDRISYNMSGVSPFSVYYRFNNENRRANLKHDFTRLATKPGNLSIIALQDSSAGQCLVNFTRRADEFERLKLRVHELPSVEISHGDSIIKNLHEGDQSEITFKFIGTPPFLVTYVRTLGDEDEQHKRRNSKRSHGTSRHVVETKTVRDIWDYEYTEVVSLQGTYEAIEVTDAFCGVSRKVEEIL